MKLSAADIKQSAAWDLPSPHRLGVLLVTVSTLAFSTTGFFTRLIAVNVWTILFWRGIFEAFFITLYLVWIHRRGTFRAVRTMGWSSVIVTVASAITMVAYIPALKLTTVANVTLIGATLPFFACLLAWVWLGERPSTSTAVASVVAFAGVGVMVARVQGHREPLGGPLSDRGKRRVCCGAGRHPPESEHTDDTCGGLGHLGGGRRQPAVRESRSG